MKISAYIHLKLNITCFTGIKKPNYHLIAIFSWIRLKNYIASDYSVYRVRHLKDSFNALEMYKYLELASKLLRYRKILQKMYSRIVKCVVLNCSDVASPFHLLLIASGKQNKTYKTNIPLLYEENSPSLAIKCWGLRFDWNPTVKLSGYGRELNNKPSWRWCNVGKRKNVDSAVLLLIAFSCFTKKRKVELLYLKNIGFLVRHTAITVKVYKTTTGEDDISYFDSRFYISNHNDFKSWRWIICTF